MLRRTLVRLAFFLLATCATAQRQPVPQTSTHAELRVHVVYADEQPAQMILRVQLLAGGVLADEKLTDNSGQALFSPIPPGTYRLRVTGEGVDEVVTESFFIQRRESSHVEYVHLRERNGANAAGSSAATIFVGDLNVPAKAQKEFKKGSEALAQNDWKKAIERLEKAVTLHPQYASAYNSLGVAWAKSGDTARARQAFKNAIRVNEHMASAYVNLSRIALKEQEYTEAEDLLGKSLRTEPENLEALTLLAGARLMNRHYDGVIASARKVHSFPSHQAFSIVHYFAARALEMERRPDDAAAEYALFLKEAPDSPEARKASGALARLKKH